MAVSDYVLQTIDLTKVYQGKDVLRQVNMKVKKGTVYGFIGLNGVGKSTLIRIVSGLAAPTSGKVELFGQHHEAGLNQARKRMGTLRGLGLTIVQSLMNRQGGEITAKLQGEDFIITSKWELIK